MIINHDHSYVNALDNEFVARGMRRMTSSPSA